MKRTGGARSWRRIGFAGVLLGLLTLLAPSVTSAQWLPVGDPIEEYLRVLQVAGLSDPGSMMVRPLMEWSPPAVDSLRHPWRARVGGSPASASGLRVEPLPASVSLFANSTVPYGRNDGVVWQGKGWTGSLQAGSRISAGPLSLTFQPQVIYHQNAEFNLVEGVRSGAGPYENPSRGGIDLPQRFGPEAFAVVHPGGSSIRLALSGGEVGFGTESLWWGPGRENAIIMSNHAGGFPHVFLGTTRPVDVGIGTLEADWIWGRLSQSDWWEDDSLTDERYLTGAVLVWTPAFADGLSLGIARVFVALVPEDGLRFSDHLAVLQGFRKVNLSAPDNPSGNDEYNQLASLMARWVVRDAGFEIWAEWSRDDHSWDLYDLYSQPDHSQGYTLGFQKVDSLPGARLLAYGGELSHLEASNTFQVRAPGENWVDPGYYTHGRVRQGYTHRGQVLGAGIGPGSSAQYVWADLYHSAGRWGGFLRREVRDDNAFYREALENGWVNCCHDVLLGFGARALFLLHGGLEVGGELGLYYDANRYFQEDEDYWNVNLRLQGRWRPGR